LQNLAHDFIATSRHAPATLAGLRAWGDPRRSRTLAQKDVGRTLACNMLLAFVAQSMHIDVLQQMLPGTE